MTAILIEGPEHGTLTLWPDGSFIYDPDPDFFGQDTFSYSAFDLQPSPPATVTLIVQSQYDPAVAQADSYKGLAGQVLSASADNGVLANDENPDQALLTAVLVDDVPTGQLTLHADGAFDYDPQGFAGTTTFSYRIQDGTGLSNSQSVTLIINTPPQAVDDAYTLQEDVMLTVGAANGVLQNDLDAEGDPLTASLIQSTQHGLLTFSEDGSFELPTRSWTMRALMRSPIRFPTRSMNRSNVATVQVDGRVGQRSAGGPRRSVPDVCGTVAERLG